METCRGFGCAKIGHHHTRHHNVTVPGPRTICFDSASEKQSSDKILLPEQGTLQKGNKNILGRQKSLELPLRTQHKFSGVHNSFFSVEEAECNFQSLMEETSWHRNLRKIVL